MGLSQSSLSSSISLKDIKSYDNNKNEYKNILVKKKSLLSSSLFLSKKVTPIIINDHDNYKNNENKYGIKDTNTLTNSDSNIDSDTSISTSTSTSTNTDTDINTSTNTNINTSTDTITDTNADCNIDSDTISIINSSYLSDWKVSSSLSSITTLKTLS